MLSSALLSTWGIGVQGLTRLAYTVLIGRFFGTDDLGHASALMSLSIFAALLWPTAAANTVSRFLAVHAGDAAGTAAVERALRRSLVLSSLVLAVATVPVARLLGNGWGLSASAAALVVAYGAYAYVRGAQLGRHRATAVAVWDTVASAVALGALLIVCATGRGVLVLLPLAVGYAVFAVAGRARGPRLDGGGPSSHLMRFAAWNVLAGLTTNGLLQIAMITAQLVDPGRGAGVYAAAFTLATPASMLGQAVSQVVVPAFARRTGTSLRDPGVLRLVLVFGVVSTVAFGVVALLAPWLLSVAYPAEAEGAVPLLRFLLLGVLVFTVGLVPSALLLAAGRSRQVALASVSGFVVGLAVVPAVAAHAGVQAGSVGFLVGSSINLVVVLVLASRRSGESGRPTPEGVAAPPAA